MQFTFQHTAEIFLSDEWQEIEFTVTAQYTPASRGIRGPYGEPEEPDEAASVEILEVTDAEGNSYEWDEIEGIMGAAVEWADENAYICN
jgi:hypothetical protein